MILVESGEIGIFANAGEAVLRPSLYAMSKIGTPSQIVERYVFVMADFEQPQIRARQRAAARDVVFCCGRDEDMGLLFDLFGCLDETGKPVDGIADPDHVIALARCLLKHGVTGALPPEKVNSEGGGYAKTFEAREYVSLAIAHLGVSEREAWDMTMTTLVGALRAKFPPMKEGSTGANAPAKEEMEATLAWHDRVLELRKKKLH